MKRDGGAFPGALTVRDYIAAAALQGLCACSVAITHEGEEIETDAGMARLSYALADAMMEERAK